MLISSAAFFLLLYVSKKLLTDYIFIGIDFYPIVLVCLVAMIFNCTHTFFDTILRSQQNAKKATVLSVIYFFINAGFSILFVVPMHMGALGIVLAILLAGLIYTIYMTIEMAFKKLIAFKFDFQILKSALKYSIPIIPHNLSPHIAMMVSKVLISSRCSPALLGIYSVATQFGSLADTVQIYVNQAYGPWLFEKLNNHEDSRKEIRSVSKLLATLIGGIFILIALFAHDYIVLLVDHKYVSAWHYVPAVIMVFAVKTTYYFYVNVLFYYKEAARVLFVATLTGSLACVILAFLLIPQIGLYGAILADGLAMVIQVAIIFKISLKYDDVGLKMHDFIVNILLVSLFFVVGLLPSFFFYDDVFSIYNLIFKIVVSATYAGIVFMCYKSKIKNVISNLRVGLLSRKPH
jgi:O-antigen/teichoic acid export membrane protein